MLAAQCSEIPSEYSRDNPFDSSGVNWNPPSIQIVPVTHTYALGDSATVVANGSDNGHIAEFCWYIDTFVQKNTGNRLSMICSEPGTRTIRVRAIDNDGVKSVEDTAFIRVRDKAPLLFSPINGAVPVAIKTRLTWTAGFYNDHYQVLLDTINPPKNIVQQSTTDTFFTRAQALLPQTTYFWQIIGFDSSSLTAESAIWSFTTASSPVAPTNGLVAWYPFNGNTRDESSQSNDGVNNGAIPTTDRFGNSNSAYAFAGSQYIEVKADASLHPGTISISVWIQADSIERAGEWCSIIDDFLLLHGWCLDRWQNTLKVHFGNVSTVSNVLDGALYHVVAMGNSSRVKLYVNGLLEKEGIPILTLMNYSQIQQRSIFIGANDDNLGPPESFYRGSIDDLRIYNRELTMEEVLALYHEGGWPGN
jgi:hypothetical protein